MTAGTYEERDAQRVIVLKSTDGGLTWFADTTGGGGGGGGSLTDAVILAPTTSARNVIQSTGNFTPLTVKASTGQTVPLLQLLDSSGNPIASTDPSGNVTISPSDPLHNGQFVLQAAVGSSANDTDLIYVRDEFGTIVGLITANGGFRVDEQTAGQDGIRLSSHGNQLILGDFGSGQESSINVGAPSPGFAIDAAGIARIVRFTSLGDFILQGTHAAPLNATLANGECALWFDHTVGATCLKVKAKDSAGTVRTATIPLS